MYQAFLTLEQIQNSKILVDYKDDAEETPVFKNWDNLLKSMGNPLLTRQVSLGNVAQACGPSKALACVALLDWGNIQLRRTVIAALLPMLRRAGHHRKGDLHQDLISALSLWVKGWEVDLCHPAPLTEATWVAAAAITSEAGSAAGALKEAQWMAERVHWWRAHEAAVTEGVRAKGVQAIKNERQAQVLDLATLFRPLPSLKPPLPNRKTKTLDTPPQGL